MTDTSSGGGSKMGAKISGSRGLHSDIEQKEETMSTLLLRKEFTTL